MNFGLKNKVAIVCGASKGMGFSCAEALALEGVKVLMIARNEIALAESAQKIESRGGTVMVFSGDVGDLNLAIAAVNHCEKIWGGVDILINNAGGPPMGTFQEHSPLAWNLAIQTNLMSVVNFCQAVTPNMKMNKWGRIVNIISTVAKEPSPLMVLSATTRAGVAAFSKALAIELASFNISSNVICPGGVLTDRLVMLLKSKAERDNKSYKDVLFESQQSIPAKRFANPEEIADAVLFLVSEQGGYINGVSLNIDASFTNGLKIIAGVTLMENTLTKNGITEQQILTENFTGVWAVSYKIKKAKLSIDYTGNVYSPMRLPLLGDTDPRKPNSPWWSIQNIQLTFDGFKIFQLYGGLKNILNWTPNKGNPFLIARTNDPFDKGVQFGSNGQVIATANNPYGLTFDPTYMYAPNQGARVFVGFRYIFK